MSGALVVPENLAHDWRQLQDLIADTVRRQPVPCQTQDEETRALWTGTASEQTRAARECLRCPVIAQCRDYGLTHPSEEGVYGNLTQTERKKVAAMTTPHRARKAHTENEAA